MVAPFLDSGLAILRKQLQTKHPGIVIGWIADKNHKPPSDHIPEADGSVDAIDPMISASYTLGMAKAEIAAIVKSRDRRVSYIIVDGHIISSTVEPWTWRHYTGSDPHTNHWHISVNDNHENDLEPWSIDMSLKDRTYRSLDGFSYADISYGQDDDKYSGYRYVSRAQVELRYLGQDIIVDGVYGDQTRDAVRAVCGGDGNTISLKQWTVLMGLSTHAPA